MRRRSSIRKTLFAALVAASPFVFYLEGRQFPDFVDQLVLAAWLYYAVCAIVLRSTIIGGVLAAPFVLSIVAPPALGPPNETDIIVSSVAIPILGALGGWICHVLYGSRKLPASMQSKPLLEANDSNHSHVPLNG
jgi:hypothetical protein